MVDSTLPSLTVTAGELFVLHAAAKATNPGRRSKMTLRMNNSPSSIAESPTVRHAAAPHIEENAANGREPKWTERGQQAPMAASERRALQQMRRDVRP
jgi:hypothetical protein